ncbi:hypothetical protein DLQ92_25515, partial [Salmonella enterica subsp. enterica]|nr:hypothetical protein [Salmonella enterica subsp. enterica serovar Typhimurium]EBW4173300.1 hypothetical protein [Salmonella enterica subsp. enterica serovar Typhimurium]
MPKQLSPDQDKLHK